MSEADFRLLRDAYDAFNRRDPDALAQFLDSDAVWIPSSSAWGAGTAYHGHGGIGRLLEDMADDWQRFEAIPKEFRQVGDLILVLGRVRAVPQSGGPEIDSETAWIWEMRDGKGLRLQAYTDPARAIEALGLQE